jgi:L-seryl-tRNA(Ser) seleniumtransferase
MSEQDARKALLRKLPSVDELLRTAEIADLLDSVSRTRVTGTIREVLGAIRADILAGRGDGADISLPGVSARVADAVRDKERPAFMRVVNATGVVLHTGLGRGVYADEAVEALTAHIRGYTRLAYDLRTGQRAPREDPVRALLAEMTGAESAQIVNNNAAATMLVLKSVAGGKEVVCSRGELVEIGGAFRIPDVMAQSGCILREVGTTNKTHPWDYERAIGENTGALMRVHTSNYKIHGFTEAVPLEELVRIGQKHGVPVIDDLGSGTFYSMERVGLVDETVVSDSVRAGSDLICFSTDKLMSGPQGGAIVGKKKYIDKIRKDPLMRALRVDKMTLIVLEATLRVLLDEKTVWKRNHTYRMLAMSAEELDARARELANLLSWLSDRCDLEVVDGLSQVGGGATPVTEFPTRLLSVRPRTLPAGLLACKLRTAKVPVCTRVKEEAVLLDPRTVQPGEDPMILATFREVYGEA